jgi:hypothetical protein
MLDTVVMSGRAARTSKDAAVAANQSIKTYRRHQYSDNDLSDDDQDMNRPAGVLLLYSSASSIV